MQYDEAFLQAALQRAPTVLGRQLRPFCAGHLLILEALDNPLVTGDARSPEFLGQAVYICCRTFEEGRAALFAKSLLKDVHLWSQSLGQWDYPEALITFEQYKEDFTRCPESLTRDNARSLGAPTAYSIVVGLVMTMKGAMTLSEAWNMGIGLATCYSMTAAELQGSNILPTLEDLEQLRVLRAGGEWRQPIDPETPEGEAHGQ